MRILFDECVPGPMYRLLSGDLHRIQAAGTVIVEAIEKIRPADFQHLEIP